MGLAERAEIAEAAAIAGCPTEIAAVITRITMDTEIADRAAVATLVVGLTWLPGPYWTVWII